MGERGERKKNEKSDLAFMLSCCCCYTFIIKDKCAFPMCPMILYSIHKKNHNKPNT